MNDMWNAHCYVYARWNDMHSTCEMHIAMCATWLIRACDMTQFVTFYEHVRHVECAFLCVRHGSFVCVT